MMTAGTGSVRLAMIPQDSASRTDHASFPRWPDEHRRPAGRPAGLSFVVPGACRPYDLKEDRSTEGGRNLSLLVAGRRGGGRHALGPIALPGRDASSAPRAGLSSF